MKKDQIKKIAFLIIGLCSLAAISCKKYLEAKPDQSLTVPGKIKDLWAILDNTSTMTLKYPSSSEVLSDNYFLRDDTWAALSSTVLRSQYIWEKNDNTNIDWLSYSVSYASNIVLENLPKIDPGPSPAEWNSVKGSALFFRGLNLYTISQLFAPPLSQSTQNTPYGIPLRLSSNFGEKSVRSTVGETYARILSDFKLSSALLPSKGLTKTRPSMPAAYAMISKTYLAMKQYDSAGYYANKCLMMYDSLLNFNKDIIPSAAAPFKRFNREVIFHARSGSSTILAPARAIIDTTLYRSYQVNDLRKTAYFKANTGVNSGTYCFKGDYDGSGTSSGFVFAGVITDELYLIRAECYARAGQTALAMADLNKLLSTRFNTSFVPLSAVDPDQTLTIILTERRKELLFRGTRWTDLRRLKDENEHSVIPKRWLNGKMYELNPNSSGYVLQLPAAVINLSDMEQNP